MVGKLDYSGTIQRAFGVALRRARHAKDLSQEELGLQSDVHRTYISELERGEKCPTLVTVARLAAVLGMRPSELLAEAQVEADRRRRAPRR